MLIVLPGVIAVNGTLAVTGTAVMTKGINDLVNGVTTTQFNNGDRPESRTFAKGIEGKLNGKKVHYRVDAEPQGHKLQIQCNEVKKIDYRLDYKSVNSIKTAINEIPNDLKKRLTQGKLQEMAKAIYRAAKSLK
ncbi:hypothetical protein MUDAN_BIHEEGNE_03274 [Lactiplantibacillus mudanjiangensis]|uniref:hypothetical protein n=1 Tax=Lactiplantibacillus mudanjiangensis TaxID=1296538 RepID=UPI001014F07C|nr:hypothetical protein MUDAN_BIHEEGNE_03274 [Lactiplantibacillus mudanjiangensis]